MKNGTFFFLGLFAAIALSWAALALGTNAQLGQLAPYFDLTENRAFPDRAPGIAARGQAVYQDLGCAACHTQQVRRPGFGSDTERGWGARQSVARDYIHVETPQLGYFRIGPDLGNVGSRITSREQLFQLLYRGTDTMPAYPFLFEERPENAQPSPLAVAHVDGREIVPSDRAEALAAYLLSLNTTYTFPEAQPLPETTKPAEGEHK